ncbi:MAG: cation transporter, partial [Candidatus Aenigmarchaeota archaeon]|nr:cation transporter [Candidatus Aenigmarchaeota archaeon]
FKLLAGILGNSIAVVADAIHSLSDILTSIVVWIGLKFGKKPPDRYHPYGHGDLEPIAGLIVAIVLAIVGFELLRHAVSTAVLGTYTIPGTIAIIAALVSIFAKYWMFGFTNRIAKRINSPALLADSCHQKSDFLSSCVVLAGVGGAMLGFPILDPLAGFLIAFWIIKIGYDVARKNISNLMGTIPSEDVLNKIKKAVRSVKGVKGFHDVRMHYTGPHAVVSLHIKVDKSLKISEAHVIAHRVENRIKSRAREATTVLVHTEPG